MERVGMGLGIDWKEEKDGGRRCCGWGWGWEGGKEFKTVGVWSEGLRREGE